MAIEGVRIAAQTIRKRLTLLCERNFQVEQLYEVQATWRVGSRSIRNRYRHDDELALAEHDRLSLLGDIGGLFYGRIRHRTRIRVRRKRQRDDDAEDRDDPAEILVISHSILKGR